MHVLARKLVDACLPEICVFCEARCDAGLCRSCAAMLARVPEPCPRCALPRIEPGAHRCAPLAGVDTVVAPFIFEPPLSDGIHRLKYGRQRSLARALALLLVQASADRKPITDALIPVPLHRSRLCERTFNQADEITMTLATRTGIPLRANHAHRVAPTPPQALLRPDQRARNLRNAFQVSGPLDGLRLTIVDDVVTTGATVAALAVELRAAGALAVDVWAVARTLREPRNRAQAQIVTGAAPLRNT